MRQILIAVFMIVATILVLAAFLIRSKGPAMVDEVLPVPSHDDVYPQAPTMPPTVTTPVEDLLSQYEAFLGSNAPMVLSALQPGLTDSEIDTLERQHRLNLPADLRALYRWRNGTPRIANVDVFPDHEFVPLDVALINRDNLRKEVKDGSARQHRAYTAIAAHRDAWVGLLVDLAGDGYFFDPSRTQSQGSFFFCFAEDGTYIFYPAFRNYLAAVLDGQKFGVFLSGSRGIETANFERAALLWGRFGAEPPR